MNADFSPQAIRANFLRFALDCFIHSVAPPSHFMITIEPPFGGPLTWQQSVMAQHRRWEARPPHMVAARAVLFPPPPKIQPKTLWPSAPERVAHVKPHFLDALGEVDLGQERKKRLTKVSSEPVIQRLMESPPPRRSSHVAPFYAGFWSQEMSGTSLVPAPHRARGVEFAHWHAGMNSRQHAQFNLGTGLLPRGEVHKPVDATWLHSDSGQYTQYSRPKA